MTPVVAVAGTTHPYHVAGLGLTLRVAPRLGVRAVSVVAGVTAQDAAGVHAAVALPPATIEAQFAALRSAGVAAVHVGALLDAAAVSAVARSLPMLGAIPVVCDPVIAASSGERLADDATVAALRDELFPHCTLVTPNRAEAALLLDAPALANERHEAAARALLAHGARGVLITGGDAPGVPGDVLVTAGGTTAFHAPRIDGALRGTGDLLAFAIAAGLASGAALHPAIDAARAFVRAAIRDGEDVAGMRTVR